MQPAWAPPRVISLATAPLQTWRNGGGVTRELLTGPVDQQGEWRYRISVAEIARDGPFSRFEWIRRHFCVLSGLGVQLRVAGVNHTLTSDSPALAFAGNDEVDCTLINGPTTDLNFMVRLNEYASAIKSASPQSPQSQLLGLDAGQSWLLPAPEQHGGSASLHVGLFTRASGQCHWRIQKQRFSMPLQVEHLIWFTHAPEHIAFHPGPSANHSGPAAWAMHVRV